MNNAPAGFAASPFAKRNLKTASRNPYIQDNAAWQKMIQGIEQRITSLNADEIASIARNIDFNDETLTMDDLSEAVDDDGSKYKDAEQDPYERDGTGAYGQPLFDEGDEDEEEEEDEEGDEGDEDEEDDEDVEEEDEEPVSAHRPPSGSLSASRDPDDRDGTGAFAQQLYESSSEDGIEGTPHGSVESVVSSNFGRSRSVSRSNSQGFMAAALPGATSRGGVTQTLDPVTVKALSEVAPAVAQYAERLGLDLTSPEGQAELQRAKRLASTAKPTTVPQAVTVMRKVPNTNTFGVERAARNDAYPRRYFGGVVYGAAGPSTGPTRAEIREELYKMGV